MSATEINCSSYFRITPSQSVEKEVKKKELAFDLEEDRVSQRIHFSSLEDTQLSKGIKTFRKKKWAVILKTAWECFILAEHKMHYV